MAEIGIKQLKATASEVIDAVEEEGIAYVVTKRGRPAAVLMPLDDAEDVVLANAEDLVRMRRQGRTAYRARKTTNLRKLR